jgi:hypothetical protein
MPKHKTQRERAIKFAGYNLRIDTQGNMLVDRPTVNRGYYGFDTGADPLPDGKFKMYPSGDIVDLAERNRRLST